MNHRTLISFIRACKNLHKFKCGISSQAPFEVEIFDALTQHAATLGALELFEQSTYILRAIDPRLAGFQKLERLDVPIRHLMDIEARLWSTRSPYDGLFGRSARVAPESDHRSEDKWLDIAEAPTSLLENPPNQKPAAHFVLRRTSRVHTSPFKHDRRHRRCAGERLAAQTDMHGVGFVHC
jgi:hypothetical protein